MAKTPKAKREFNAGVLVVNEKQQILAVSRQPYVKAAKWSYDWGLPGGEQEKGEHPMQTASRELLEETGFSCPVLVPLLTVPAEATPDGLPYHVYRPGAPCYGRMLHHTKEGVTQWVSLDRFLRVADPKRSVRESNRWVVYWGLGWPV